MAMPAANTGNVLSIFGFRTTRRNNRDNDERVASLRTVSSEQVGSCREIETPLHYASEINVAFSAPKAKKSRLALAAENLKTISPWQTSIDFGMIGERAA